MKYQICALLLSSVLVGCGGGDGDSSSTVTPTKAGFSNGLYADADNFTLMLVDSTRAKNNLIVGDFANNGVYIAHSGTADTNASTYTTTGLLAYSDNNSFLYSSSMNLTTTFSNDTAVVAGTVNNQNLVYTFDKTDDSLSLSEITGTYTDSETGAVWTIDSGWLALNGDCLVSAKLTRNGAYFNLTEMNASNCTDPTLDGSYDDGVLMTFKYNDHDYLAGVMGRDDAIIWGRVAMD